MAPGRWREPQSPGLSRQSAYAKARDCQGGGLFPLGPPPFAAGEQISIVREAEPDQTEPAQIATGASRIEIRDLSVVQNTTLTYTQHSTAS
ncbi:hypothetical protein GCM10027295_25720 [Pseudaeromonas pectinilytica]